MLPENYSAQLANDQTPRKNTRCIRFPMCKARGLKTKGLLYRHFAAKHPRAVGLHRAVDTMPKRPRKPSGKRLTALERELGKWI